MEKIMTMLSKNGLIERVHGKDGDYRLYRALDDIRPVIFCLLRRVALPCFLPGKRYSALRQNQPMQKTLPMRKKLDNLITGFLDSITLADLITNSTADDYVIIIFHSSF
ncbi:MAG: Rrf2 family transcriptional regulator [Clostridiales bacterium]|nr:MAG: Rrf2 family transcriptional regulator [Clostridiales bacterium]